jgi:hypothetical protein
MSLILMIQCQKMALWGASDNSQAKADNAEYQKTNK